jgi:hypothetical protein
MGANVAPGVTIPGQISGWNTIAPPAVAGTASTTNLAPNGTTVIPNACTGQVVQSISAAGVITCGAGGGGGSGASYYQTVQANSAAQTQRANLNFSADFALADSAADNGTTVNLASPMSASTTGNAATATRLAAAPTQCAGGQAPTGVDVFGNPQNCTSIGAGTAAPGARHTCIIENDTQSATALTAAQFSGRCVIPSASTIIEVEVMGGTGTNNGIASAPAVSGTSSVQLGRYTPNGGSSTASLLSGILATASGKACALTSTSGTCINGTTSSNSVTISSAAVGAGDMLYVSAATADNIQTWFNITIVYTVN